MCDFRVSTQQERFVCGMKQREAMETDCVGELNRGWVNILPFLFAM